MVTTDVILEVFRTCVLLVLVGYLLRLGRKKNFIITTGWKYIQTGFLLVLFGSILDITDNFDALNAYVVIGDTEVEAFLEKVVGYLLGFIFLTIGLIQWGPSVEQMMNEIAERREAEKALSMHQDNLEKVVNERTEELQRKADYDVLTDLPNRALLKDRLEQDLARAKRNKNNVAVLFVDLDGFKSINDAMGHSVGDDVLRQVSQRMKDCVRTTDTVARYGGDEFVVVMPDISSRSDATIMAEKLSKTASIPLNINGVKLPLGMSIGIALYPEHSENQDVLLVMADQAMYHAKRGNKRGGYCYASLEK